MVHLLWILPGILSFGVGWFFVSYLTVHPLRMRLHLASILVLSFALVAVLVVGFEGWQLLLASLLSLAFFLAGYAVKTHQVLSREDETSLPAITRQKGDPGDGHTSVVYLTHGEPETYNPMAWIGTFQELDATGAPFVPWIARPFFLRKLREEYLHVGESNHRQNHLRMVQALEAGFRKAGDATTRFYLAFLDDDPRPGAATIQALNEGASAIVVVEVFVSISNHTAEGRKQVEEIRPEEYGVPVRFSGPLWDSNALHQMFVDKTNAAIGDADRSKVGILLVGHGQPDEWDREFPTETEHEIQFRQAILALLEQEGYRPENMGQAWMEFKEPEPAEKVEELVQNGVDTILYFAVAISADSLHSQYDIPALVGKAKVPPGVSVINLGAWNDHPRTIQAIKELAEAHMSR